MIRIALLFLIFSFSTAHADALDPLTPLTQASCLSAFSLGQGADLNDPHVTKCTAEGHRISAKILGSKKFAAMATQDKIRSQAEGFLILFLCREFASVERQYSCYQGAIEAASNSAPDLKFLNRYALTTSENFLKRQKPNYIFLSHGSHTETGQKFFETRYVGWISYLLEDYVKSSHPDAALVTNKHPDVAL